MPTHTHSADSCLLAYIHFPGSHEVWLDLIHVSRRSTSYHYRGIVWNRPAQRFGNDLCRDPDGNQCYIAPLSRHHKPGWIHNKPLQIAAQAQQRYQLWLNHQLSRESQL